MVPYKKSVYTLKISWFSAAVNCSNRVKTVNHLSGVAIQSLTKTACGYFHLVNFTCYGQVTINKLQMKHVLAWT